MNRTIEQWSRSDASAMCTKQSINAQIFAMQDAKSDILELHAQNKRMKLILQIIAYPRRGTDEEYQNIKSAAKLIQSSYTVEQLEA